MHAQYLSKCFIITHCSAQKRSNQGLFLSRIIFTFMGNGNWAANFESWLWGSVETVNGLCITILCSTESGSASEGLAASDLVMAESCWLSSLHSVVSCKGDSPQRCVMEALVLQGGRARG